MSAVSRINWGKLASAVAAKQQTQASLVAFRKQYEDLRRQLSVLEDQKVSVDFQAYRKVLSNQKVVDQLEATQKKFKPVAYNLAAQEKLIIEKAQAAAEQIESEVSSLKETLKNIETARPVEDLSIDDVTQAIPEIDQKVEEMLKKGQWSVPGYSDRVGNIGFF